ncbi:hypothetical protein A8C32_13430 [Flavivirga aquatica]|uniref:N-acetyltransferase domain-containing protein n=1 Tax=Flavivirga aquatica TaxID=1849968 RepID=A0A1E5TEC8_9FLAO|nr:GNAT family N-acetyltransferase [Flavivirga aquatica]OEK09697.1 hypothetical protein A8C32_13430 [Flavivirga aquatica]
MIKKILKKDVPEFIQNPIFWNHSFLSVTKHRLYAHYMNPNCDDDDIVLLLAYLNDEIVGYMGVFIDIIEVNGKSQKIGWLSTWWVHPKTKGTGIGRKILNTMYESLDGRIGVSQFTPSAKRVYVKSGYFNELKTNKGFKFAFRSNLNIVIPLINPKLTKFLPLFSLTDILINLPINLKNQMHKFTTMQRLKNIKIEYVNIIDNETEKLIRDHSSNHLSQKSPQFFQWLKAHHWVQEAPLIKYDIHEKYEFSMSAEKFNIYFTKVFNNNKLVGFLVLQRKNHLLKVLFAYYIDGNQNIMANLILLHAFKLKIKELVCYDEKINNIIVSSKTYLYKRKKLKESIISKVFEEKNYSNYNLNFGDGDCCFA